MIVGGLSGLRPYGMRVYPVILVTAVYLYFKEMRIHYKFTPELPDGKPVEEDTWLFI